MKKYLLITIVFLSGSTLSIFKYNGFNVWDLPINTAYAISIIGSIVFLGSIIVLNSNAQTFAFKITPLNFNVQKTPELYKKSSINFTSKPKYYLLVIIVNIIISTYLGFKFKILMADHILNRIFNSESKWQKNNYVEVFNSKNSFFLLGESYDFNWELSITWFILVVATLIFIRNTIYYDKIVQFFQKIMN